MTVKPWTAAERARILRELQHAREQGLAAADREDAEAEEMWDAKAEELQAAYYAGLPRLVMACCPFDGKPLVRSFDPMGLDGLWWTKNATPEEVPSCPHFCVLGGAVNYQGLPPRAGNEKICPGPEIPFVYPRVLALPDMVAVISSLPMENGYLAYPIAYFARQRPHGEQLTAGWRRTHHDWTDAFGNSGWRVENDKWDFALRPWLAQGKIRWTPPGSDRTILSQDPAEPCPYLDLPGEHKAVCVYKDRFGYEDPPDGSYISPYED